MRRRLLAVGLLVLALGAITATGAFTGGDEVAAEVYLNPAPTDEGDRYASFDGDGELRVEITGLNDDAVSDFHEVFNVSSSTDGVSVWFEHNASGVTLYRSDTGQSIDGAGQPIDLGADETVPVGIRADSTSGDVSIDTVHLVAEVADGQEETPTDTPSTDTPEETPTDTPSTDTPEETPTDTPTEPAPGGGVVITPDSPTTTEPTPTDTPTAGGAIEVAGFPLWLLALLGLALLALLALLAAWRLRGEPSVTVRLPPESALSIAPGDVDDVESTVVENGVAVRLGGERIATAGSADGPDTVSRVVTVANGADGPVAVSARFTGRAVEGLSLLADDPARTDLLVDESTLGGGDSMAISLLLPENTPSRNLDIVVETSNVEWR